MTIQTAWTLVLRTPEGQAVLADILRRSYHFTIANDDEHRVLQQFAIQTLQMAALSTDQGSFPFDYVSMLAKTKLQRPGFFVRLWRRLFGRKF